MAYNYYQTQVPGWGTTQFQFGAPPVPTFHPQPSWRGYDFYNAHAASPDPGLFESIMGRLRDVLGLGIGHSDARHWHKKVYSGMVPLSQLLPADIGAAAAYEAYRTWKYNSFLYEPLSADRERQREGLIGMAIAETQRLWQYSGRPHDAYGLRAACEAAAAAGSSLADRLFSSYGSNGLGRSSSFSSASDAYAYDDGYNRHGRRSRHNSFNNATVVRVGGGSPSLGHAVPAYAGSAPGAVPMPIPGQPIGAQYAVGTPGSYGTYGTPYAASAQAALPGSYTYGSGLSGRVSPSPYGAPQVAAAAPYTYNGMPVGGGFAPSASPYPGAQPGGYVLPNGQSVPPGSTVVITKSRSRRHSSASRHHKHHSGGDYGDYDYGRDFERERERADRERHERDRIRWEQEEQRQQYGMDEYGRYGRVGGSYDAGMPGAGYGYGGRY
ncbi:hypothetical protein GSI_03848 [Ganoderma sinense ZZ0214-1]|uniref:Uncharacterized protein n=1 Tax=Ganoderma sinense ZZ0214-1 TaxID=1077348 RepID=A0A2G8SK65_9APHY|nr:hypothetical protein GSI_03848 [Ganoderma sinense ZZ0214-1]